MSLLKANAVQLGQSLTASQNFTLYQPASPDGTVRLGNGNSGSVTDLITVGSTGNLTFTGTTETYTNSVTISAASTKTLTLNGGAGSNGLVIDVSNNVGIGGSPGSGCRLDVVDTASNLRVRSSSSTSTNAPKLTFWHEGVDLFVLQGGVDLRFLASGSTERMRLNTTGAVVLQGGNTAASGVGIAFPATQSASSDANTLDDYEEGTWTPNQGSGLTVVGTFSSNGSYTKVGRLVTIRGIVFGSTSVAASSAGKISSNLPFTPTADTAGSYFNGTLSVGGQVDAAPTGVFAVGTIAATTGIYFSATYEV